MQFWRYFISLICLLTALSLVPQYSHAQELEDELTEEEAPKKSSRSRTKAKKSTGKSSSGGFRLFGKGDKKKKTSEDKTRPVQKIIPIARLSQTELNEEFLNAASSGNIRLMRDLLDEGAIVNSRNRHGRTALIEAARTGNMEIVKILIDYGASVNTRDQYDGTALVYASRAGYLDIVNLLLKHGAQNVQN